MRYWWCRIAAVGFSRILAVGSYIHRNSVPYRLLTEKIFPCSGTKDFFLQRCQKNLFLQDVKKIFFCGDEGVSNFKKSQTINTTSSMTKWLSSTMKALAPAKKKTGKLDLFQSNFTKSWFLSYCMLLQEFAVCLPPPFYLFFWQAMLSQLCDDCLIGQFSWCRNCFLLSIHKKGVTFFPNILVASVASTLMSTLS